MAVHLAAGLGPLTNILAASMRLETIFSLLLLTVLGGFHLDMQAARAVDRIERLAATCLSCHGVENMKTDPDYHVPKLGLQHSRYIVQALKAYQSGERQHPIMRAQAAALTSRDMTALAAVLSNETAVTQRRLTLPVPPATHPAKVVAICGTCHGETGLGNMVEYPVLSGQHADYLVHALNDYRDGKRKSAIMPAIAKALSDDEIKELADYFSVQSSQASLKTASTKLNNAINSIDMVDVPGGTFWMGAEPGKEFIMGRPKHQVQIKPFRMGAYSVTFDQYDAFTADTSRPRAADEGWGRANRPVVNVSWSDIQDFIVWLNQKTNRQFRLPSEAEREYAASAGASTNNWWGDKTDPEFLNARGTKGRDQWEFTAPVGQFPPNPFGLYDLAGNVWERTADCWHASYVGAPVDGSAWTDDPCAMHVIRGGYWQTPGLATYSRARSAAGDAFMGSGLGFRLAESP